MDWCFVMFKTHRQIHNVFLLHTYFIFVTFHLRWKLDICAQLCAFRAFLHGSLFHHLVSYLANVPTIKYMMQKWIVFVQKVCMCVSTCELREKNLKKNQRTFLVSVNTHGLRLQASYALAHSYFA